MLSMASEPLPNLNESCMLRNWSIASVPIMSVSCSNILHNKLREHALGVHDSRLGICHSTFASAQGCVRCSPSRWLCSFRSPSSLAVHLLPVITRDALGLRRLELGTEFPALLL